MIEAKRVRANDHRNTSEESESLDYEGGLRIGCVVTVTMCLLFVWNVFDIVS